jgi:hypothetical protein
VYDLGMKKLICAFAYAAVIGCSGQGKPVVPAKAPVAIDDDLCVALKNAVAAADDGFVALISKRAPSEANDPSYGAMNSDVASSLKVVGAKTSVSRGDADLPRFTIEFLDKTSTTLTAVLARVDACPVRDGWAREQSKDRVDFERNDPHGTYFEISVDAGAVSIIVEQHQPK